MKLQNKDLLQFIQYLLSLSLVGKASRMRTRFKNLLLEHYNVFEKEYREIEDVFKEDEETRNNELTELLVEQITIDVTEERKDMLLSVKYSILDDPQSHSGMNAEMYDRFCEIVEQIKYKDEQ